MANLRERPSAINRDLLEGARWFAGKHRRVTCVRPAGRLEPEGSRGAAVELVDVHYADGGAERYALALRDGRECRGNDPLWPALARAAGVEARSPGRFLAEDLSNTVVRLGGAVLKLYRRPEPGDHPEIELLRALEGVEHAPRLLGVLEWRGSTLACMQAFVAGTAVGWERLIARLSRGEDIGGEPAELTRVTATLHRALAERLGVRAGRFEPKLARPQDGELAHVAAAVARLGGPREASLQRVHGDLHVGQFVRSDDRLVVLDWEGEPGVPVAERRALRPALRDLASLRLSLAHAARAAHRREPGFGWRAWSETARDEALHAYEGIAGRVDCELLHMLEIEKEIAELAYAERWLPEWLYAPRDVLPFLLEAGA